MVDSFVLEHDGVNRVDPPQVVMGFLKNFKYRFIVSIKNKKPIIIGYIAYTKPARKEIQIENLFILPKFRNKGYGKIFIQQLKSKYIRIWLDVYTNNKAESLYKRLGFVIYYKKMMYQPEKKKNVSKK